MNYDDARRRVLALAERQRSLITGEQLRACGMSRTAVATDRERGVLVPVFAGVDRIGGSATSPRQTLDAALMVLPEPSGAARMTALALHGIVARLPALPGIVVPYGCSVRLDGPGGRRTRARVRLHRSRSLADEEIVIASGTRTTDVTRAILEVRAELKVARWRDLAAAALRRNLTTTEELLARLAILGNITGGASIRRELATLPEELARARSAPEVDLPGLFVAAGLPRPLLNHEIRDETGGVLIYEVDCAFPALQLGYELDSRRWHTLPSQVLKDEVKDLRLAALGWVVHRIPMPLLDRPRYLGRLLVRTYEAARGRQQ